MHYKNIPFSGVCIKIFNKFTLCFFYFVDILLYPNLPSFVKKKKKSRNPGSHHSKVVCLHINTIIQYNNKFT